ncbi:hypothetical protein [Paracoccus sp. SCSIO 75233]|uniref:hypothetical protein n=1 Tax=Paracoccus sp. SCSIO 75233 TaxID=3017782 RepID=UPI0022F048C6|nr:hypothetical protein [Paracoccus sp. SCSIO 75233]WBU52701.1 hypothetical protein PAF12_12870 [Paracoccus sp. SCSIO 75233]
MAVGLLLAPVAGNAVAAEMVPNRFYKVVVPGMLSGRVAFLDDGRVIAQRSREPELEQKGTWFNRDGLLCLVDEPGDKPICLKMLPHPDAGAFSLKYMIWQADLTPEQ